MLIMNGNTVAQVSVKIPKYVARNSSVYAMTRKGGK